MEIRRRIRCLTFIQTASRIKKKEIEMAKLTDEQIKFLNSHGVNESQTFDATGYKRSEYKEAMRELDLQIAYGVTPCEKGGHTLRTKSGHCLQCAPLNLTFSKRDNDGGILYIAYSAQSGYIKIGSSQSIDTRAKTLRQQNYGGFSDWVIHDSFFVTRLAGQIEFEMHRRLKNHLIKSEYHKDGKMQKSREIFDYPAEKASKEIRKIAKDRIK
jgi:hypothetical protein